MLAHDYAPPRAKSPLGRWRRQQRALCSVVLPTSRVRGRFVTPGQQALLRAVPNWDVGRRQALVDLRADAEQETEEAWKMKAVDIGAHTAFPQGLVLQRDRDWLSMWREDVDAAALYEQAEANEGYLYVHDYTDSPVTFGRHKGQDVWPSVQGAA